MPVAISRFSAQRRVRMVDTDASGAVHPGAWIRMMEETEYAFLRDRDLSVVLSDERDGLMGFPRLSAAVTIENPLEHRVGFDDEVLVELSLMEVDGKQIQYDFRIECLTGEAAASTVAVGQFVVACCRFPAGKPPYAILTPMHVVDALTGKP